MLLKVGANVNAKGNKGSTPLHQAAMVNDFVIAEVLLKVGANVNAKDNNGFTPLHYAAMKNASATAVVLGRYGAQFVMPDE